MINRLLFLITTAFLVSCGAEKVVQWDTLTELDDLTILLENAAYEHETEKQKELLLQVKTLIPQVVGSVPGNAKNKEQVGILLKDLSSLTAELTQVENLDQDTLDGLSKSIHPIVERVMETAGVPHAHPDSTHIH